MQFMKPRLSLCLGTFMLSKVSQSFTSLRLFVVSRNLPSPRHSTSGMLSSCGSFSSGFRRDESPGQVRLLPKNCLNNDKLKTKRGNKGNGAQEEDIVVLYQPIFEKGDKIQVEIISFGPLGASVDVIAHNSHDPADCISSGERALGRGLVLQRELNYFREKRGGVDIVKYETVPAYVERVREEQFEEDGDIEIRLDISLRPYGGKAKSLELEDLIIEKLKEENGALNIGDKSAPEDINRYFPGASKSAFKRAVSGLYKKGLVSPGPSSISLV